MDQLASAGLLGSAFVVLVGSIAVGLTSVRESEVRAASVALAAGVLSALVLALAASLPPPVPALAVALLVATTVAAVVAFALPIGRVSRGGDMPSGRFDERDVVFARAHLEPGSKEYESYYAMRPENRKPDDRARALPGLLSPRARFANRRAFAAAKGSFWLTESLRNAVDAEDTGAPPPRVDWSADEDDPADLTSFILHLARFYGAEDAGVTHLAPQHVYSHIGRGTGTYGEPVVLDHTFAVAFTVEMAFDMVSTAPTAPVVMESARQYVECARIAVPLAAAIRELGYSARAHIDGNYRVIAPLVARDAGLGEIGRMGLLMTPRLGPRVRVGVVTTDAPLLAASRRTDLAVIDFCTICKKCAACCPSQSIPWGDREEIGGALRWRIDADSCFRYWNVIGTDCGRCMAVCPYSHPDTWMHNAVRWGLRHSGAFRRAAIVLDDVFYGRVPPSKSPPAWLR